MRPREAFSFRVRSRLGTAAVDMEGRHAVMPIAGLVVEEELDPQRPVHRLPAIPADRGRPGAAVGRQWVSGRGGVGGVYFGGGRGPGGWGGGGGWGWPRRWVAVGGGG